MFFPSAPIQNLLLYCRAGFEKECAAEISEAAARLGIAGYCKAKPESGYVQFVPHATDGAVRLPQIRLADLIFSRQIVYGAEFLLGLPVADRLQALFPSIQRLGSRFADLRMETADTNDAKELNLFCRKFTVPLRRALTSAGIDIAAKNAVNLHLFFLDSTAVHVGWSDPANASPWLMGIPRLKFPGSAPSRSTLKLEEAFLSLLTDAERETRLRPGMTAADLGAAPGGWTWQLVKRGLHVTAVDNGAMASELMESGMVEHLKTDGFRYSPSKSVDWLVCDMVEQPARIAALVGRWLAEGRCRHAVFNLKLPMKKRYEEVRRCTKIIEQALSGTRYSGRLRLKQLYHDREEVTGYIGL